MAGEFYTAHKAGLSYADWRLMCRWQVQDFMVRVALEKHEKAKGLKGKNWKEILAAVINRVLGIA